MLHPFLVEQLSKKVRIAPLHIIREYMEMEVLYSLSQIPLSERIIFYGGTALRLAHNSFRFSEDLDFLYTKIQKEDKEMLARVLETVIENNAGVSVEEVHEKRNTLFGLLHIAHPLLKHAIRLKLEIAKRQNGIKAENMLLMSQASTLQPIMKTASLNSLQQNKLVAIQDRNEARDWFDLWYINQKLGLSAKPNKQFPFNNKEFTNELKRFITANYWKIIPNVISYYAQK